MQTTHEFIHSVSVSVSLVCRQRATRISWYQRHGVRLVVKTTYYIIITLGGAFGNLWSWSMLPLTWHVAFILPIHHGGWLDFLSVSSLWITRRATTHRSQYESITSPKQKYPHWLTSDCHILCGGYLLVFLYEHVKRGSVIITGRKIARIMKLLWYVLTLVKIQEWYLRFVVNT